MALHTGALQVLEEIYQERNLLHYAAKQKIPLQEDDVWIVYRGVVQIQALHYSGDESILGMLGPMMPFSRAFTDLDSYDVQALTKVDLLRLRWRDIQKSPALAMEINQLLTRRLQQTEILLSLLNKNQIEERLLRFLAFLAGEFGKESPEGICIDIRLTHQQIANMVGTTRVTVTKLLGTLKKASLLRKGNSKYLCVHRDVLTLYQECKARS
ncbi:MAG: Crp/Fnr family transcriptional regulator [Gloeobacterales cyanobacterium]